MSDDIERAQELTDTELYHRYQEAKEHGPVTRIDELQLEIAKRWEERMEMNRNV